MVVSLLVAYCLISSMPNFSAQLVGLGYPLYATVWALRSEELNGEQLKSWMLYWAVYGAFSLVDSVLLPFLLNVTVYWLAKIVFLFYLVCTHPLGSTEIFEKGLNPMMIRLDQFLTRFN